ncbi:MAG: twin-arginine translocase subunit TatC [Thermoproteales archaeon]|nr:twin-arginine translocase subunit TatC [Thermoproteales archaeon]
MRFVEAYLLDFEAHPLGPLAERLGAARVGARVVAGGVFDTLLASLYLSSTISLIVVLPYSLYEVYRFAEPGLYPHEARLVRRYFALFTLLFLLGCAYACLVVAPLTTLVMLWLTAAGGAEPY